ncbi:MAG: glycosyltransferase family 39 protein [Anaerolineales bacterium]|nr:glycosyltransferase family 39 protein [Anaerolineales bacterium]
MLKESLLLNKDISGGSWIQRNFNSTVLLGLVLLLGTTLRLYDLGAESYWIDEMSTVIEGQQTIKQLFTSGRLDQPPAYYLPFHLWMQLFSATEISTRLFSAMIGIGSIVLIYLIGLNLFSKEVGLISAFLMSISEFQIYYSQVARFYSFFEFTTLLSFLFFILALRRKTILQFTLYTLASIIMVYSHTYGMFILAAQGIFFILHVKKYKNLIAIWLMCQGLIVLALLPYFYPLIFGAGGGVGGAIDLNIGGLPAPSPLDPFRSIYRFIMSARRDRNWEIMFANYAIAGILLVAGTWIYSARSGMGTLLDEARSQFNLQKLSKLKSKCILLSFWLLCPIIFPFILSFVVGPMYQDHYMISAAPALYLLMSLGIFSVRKLVPTIISLSVLMVIILPGLGYYYATDIHEQWKEVALHVDENSGPNDVIVVAPNQGIGIEQKTFDWYYEGSLNSYGFGSDFIDSATLSEALIKAVSGYDRVWVVMRDDPNESYYRTFFLDTEQIGMNLIEEHHFFEISAYLFEIPE